jgi:predicted Zn-dependent peptidase
MFKSTDKIASGAFSKIVSRLGGQDNAFTTTMYTGYFQRISKERLATVMEMEADRMANLQLAEKDVLTEREVILEERRSRTENTPPTSVRADVGRALPKPSLPRPHHWLDARDRQAVARQMRLLLQALLRPQQCASFVAATFTARR